MAIFAVAVLVGILAFGDRSMFLGWSYLVGVVALLLYLAVASQSGRFFVEAQRNGLLELLLETPLTPREIVQGQWGALKRMLGAPVVIFVAAQAVGVFIAYKYMWGTAVAATPPTTNTTTASNPTTPAILVSEAALLSLINSVGGALTSLANFVALIWFGMWMGMNSKNNNLSTLKTIAFVQIIPWFAVSFASNLIMMLVLFPGLAGSSVYMLSPLIATALYLAKDAAFIIWARRKLYSEFRERASRSFGFKPPKPPAVPQPGEIGIS